MSTKQKSGLHKEISSIFSGVPLPDDSGANRALIEREPVDKNTGHIPSMPSVSPRPPEISHQEQAKAADKAKQAPVPVVKPKEPSKLNKQLNGIWQVVKVKLMTPPEGTSPAKHKAILISMPILILVVVFVFGRFLLNSGVKGKGGKDTDSAISSLAPKTEIEWQKPEVFPANLRDPMKKASEQGFSAGATTEVVVRGIVWSEDSPSAVIGAQIVYQGQTINDVTVIKIEKDSVEFEKDGKRWTQKVAN